MIDTKEYRKRYYKDNKSKIILNSIEWQKRNSERTIHSRLKYAAKIRGITFNLDKDEFVTWFKSQNKICCYCNIKLKMNRGKLNHNNLYSIDRMDNNKGYELNNICLSCFLCNRIKSKHFDYNEMLQIGNTIKRINKNRL